MKTQKQKTNGIAFWQRAERIMADPIIKDMLKKIKKMPCSYCNMINCNCWASKL